METLNETSPKNGIARRQFLRYAGAGAMIAAGAVSTSSCKKNVTGVDDDHVDLGSGDFAILNYAYALEQLEAAFYTQVMASPFAGMTSTETALLTDIRDHEILHREFFKAALGGNAIPALTPNFTSINFADRASVLGNARSFEDLGVAAYNGSGYLLQSAVYLGLAGKIVSVEARHAAVIRDIISYNSFVDAGIVDVANTSLEISKSPNQVIPIANSFLIGKHLSSPTFGAY